MTEVQTQDWMRGMLRTPLRWVVLFCLLSIGRLGVAQIDAASIAGQVLDPSGAVLPGVVVTATNSETGIQTKATTTAAGYYQITDLKPGPYSLSVEAAGFKKLVRLGIVLQVQDRLDIKLKMEVGNASENLTVTTEVPQLRPDDTQTGEVLDYQLIQDLPQYTRDPLQLLTLSGDVQGSGARANGGSYSDTRINGGRTSSVDYLVDGISVLSGQNHSANNSTPGNDDVQELKVLTNGLTADIGRVSGGAVTMVTKSGTNQLHGQVYEYYQNAALDDSGWQQKANGGEKTPFHNFDTGYAVGGPVILPHLYHGRDKTFFFTSFEDVHTYTSGTLLRTSYPSAAERTGDLSGTMLTLADGTVITPGTAPYQMWKPCFAPTDCSSGPVPVPAGEPNAGTTAVQKYNLLGGDGMHVPSDLISPVSMAILNTVPLPNHAPIAGTSDAGNYIGSQNSTSSGYQWAARIDHQFSDKDNIFGRFQYNTNSSGYTAWAGPEVPATGSRVNGGWRQTLSYTHVFSPTLSMTLNAGVFFSPYSSGNILPAGINGGAENPFGYDATTAGLLNGNNLTNNVFFQGNPSATFTPYTGSASSSMVNSTTGQFGGAFTKVLSKHVLQIGAESRRFYYDTNTSGSGYTYFDSDPLTHYAYDCGGTCTYGELTSLGSFLMGLMDYESVTSNFNREMAQNYYASYAQDSFKVNPRLTLQLGLRWDMETPATERNNKIYMWDQNAPSPFTINAGWDWNTVLEQAGVDPSQVQTPSWVTNGFPKGAIRIAGTPEHPSRFATGYHPWQFAPRLGLSFKIDEKTVVRAYGGIMYLSTTGDPNGYGTVPAVQVTGGALSAWHQNQFGVVPSEANWDSPYTPGEVTPYTRDNQVANYQSTGGIGAGGVATTMHMPHEYNWTLGIQRELPGHILLEATYAANASHSLLASDAISRFPKNLLILQNQSLYTTEINSPTGNPLETNSDNVAGPQQLLGILEFPYPYFATVVEGGHNIGRSNYESLNLRVEKRLTNGLQLLFNYGFSKSLDNVGGPEEVDGGLDISGSVEGSKVPQSVDTVRDVYGLSPLDETHRITAFYLYQLPFGRGRKWLGNPYGVARKILDGAVGGWEISGTATYRSGRPVYWNFSGVNVNNNIRVETTYGSCLLTCTNADLITSHFKGPKSVLTATGATPTGGTAFNSANFIEPQPFTYGDLKPIYGAFRHPGNWNSDMSLMKRFSIFSTRDVSRFLQFRAEAANVFNIAGLGPYNTTLGGVGFGTITSVNNQERHIQMSMKYVF